VNSSEAPSTTTEAASVNETTKTT